MHTNNVRPNTATNRNESRGNDANITATIFPHFTQIGPALITRQNLEQQAQAGRLQRRADVIQQIVATCLRQIEGVIDAGETVLDNYNVAFNDGALRIEQTQATTVINNDRDVLPTLAQFFRDKGYQCELLTFHGARYHRAGHTLLVTLSAPTTRIPLEEEIAAILADPNCDIRYKDGGCRHRQVHAAAAPPQQSWFGW